MRFGVVRSFALVLLMGATSSAVAKIILWDLGNVLAKSDKSKIGFYLTKEVCGLNPFKAIKLSVLRGKGILSEENMRRTLDEVMHRLRPNEPQNKIVINDDGAPLTTLECDHINGIRPGDALFAQIQESIKQIAREDKRKKKADRFFEGKTHKYLIEKTLELCFKKYESFAQCFQPIEPGVQLLAKCAANGTNTVAMLANCDPGLFTALKNQAQLKTVFRHFRPEHIFISGILKTAKPYPQAFEAVIQRMNATPQDFILIDDQLANIEAARALGMYAIYLHDENYAAVEMQLRELGAL
jgi:FMN phosphatase YigB (HAD superfamily)